MMSEIRHNFQNEIISLIHEIQDANNLYERLEAYHPYDVSRALLEVEDDVSKSLMNHLPNNYIAEIFEYLSVNEFKSIQSYLEIDIIANIISQMELDAAVDLIIGLKKSGIEILKHIPQKRRQSIQKMMTYKPDEIGAYLNDSYLTVQIDDSVKKVMKYVTQNAHDTDYISIIYVVENLELKGYVRLKDLITARANELMSDVMETRFPHVLINDDVETVANMMQETKESSIPIIDESFHLQGIVTHDDLLEIIAMIEEEDYTRFAGLSDFDQDINTLSIKQSVKSRLPWLSILLILSMVTSSILSLFDSRLSVSGPLLAARLAVFLPLILDMAGNTGTQSLAVTIRYLTKNDQVDRKMIRSIILREFKTGIVQGILIGFIVFGMILLTSYWTNDVLVRIDYIYALVTSISIIVALIVSTTLGGFIPLLLDRFKIDPAVASGPFITTVSDIVTLCIYYAIGMSILLPLY
jgi:magnesium transporter